MGYTVSQIQGVIASTRETNPEKKWTDLASEYQEYPGFNHLMNRSNMKYGSGTEIQFNIVYDRNKTAKHTALYEVDSPSQDDYIKQGTVPWIFSQADYSFDIREPKINSGTAEQLIDLVKERKETCRLDLATLVENAFWSKPANSSDARTPFGIFYWIVKASGKTALADTGFNGGNPTGFSDGAAGINSDIYTRWKNWAGNYVTVSKADLIKKMRKAAEETFFVSPMSVPSYEPKSVENRFQVYTNLSVKQDMEDVGEAQNENLGRDIASMDGVMMFRRNPIKWVPLLDSDTSNPVMFLNWDVLTARCLKGEFMRESTQTSATQHNVINAFTDLSWNIVCTNRRRLSILSI